MIARSALVFGLLWMTGCDCKGLCTVAYIAAVDDCDDSYPPDQDASRNQTCRLEAEQSYDRCVSGCADANRPQGPVY